MPAPPAPAQPGPVPDAACDLCGDEGSDPGEVIIADAGGWMFVCPDTDRCETRRASGPARRLGAGSAGVVP